MICCKICGKEFTNYKGLGSHIKQTHKIETKKYYDMYLKEPSDGVCSCGNMTRFKNLNTGYSKHCSLKCAHNDEKCKEKRKATNLERYGSENVLSQHCLIRQKAKETIKRRYGSTEIFSTKHFQDKHKENSLQKYGTEWPMQNKEVFARNMKSKRHYFYDNTHFDSTWELAFWIYCKDKDIPIEREPCKIKYLGIDNKPHYYFPDFRINNKTLIEIKADHLLDSSGKLKDKAKQTCIDKYKIKLLRSKDIQKYLDYCENKFQDTSWFKTYVNQKTVNTHKPTKHKSKNLVKPMTCAICNKTFQNGNYLAAHLKFEEYITSKIYYDTYLKKDGEGFCEVCHKPTKYIGLRRGYQVCCSIQCAAKEKGVKVSITKQRLKKEVTKSNGDS